MSLAYLAGLLVSMACIALLDARYRLFLWRAPLRATIVLAIGVAYLLAWDAAGIALDIFFRDANAFSTGVLLAPHLPVEEPVFLLFLCQITMTAYCGAVRLFGSDGRTP